MKSGHIILSALSFLIISLAASDPLFGGMDHSPYASVSQCVGCHPRALPTHMRDKPKKAPKDYPLDEKGRMLCITCHECITGTCVLRDEPQELCMVCHDCSKGMACLLGVAHLGDDTSIVNSGATFCFGCHDGAVGESKAVAGEHPIEIMYIPSKSKDLKKIKDRRIVMINGVISCVSCHNPYNSADQALVKSNHESKLCLTCHKK